MNTELLRAINKLRESGSYSPDQLAQRFKEEGLRFSASDIAIWNRFFISTIGGGQYLVPEWLARAFSQMVAGFAVDTVCDPWAGFGFLLAVIGEATGAKHLFAHNWSAESVIGSALVPNADWRMGDPLRFLAEFKSGFDVVASILPMGLRGSESSAIKTSDGETISLKGDYGHHILVASA